MNPTSPVNPRALLPLLAALLLLAAGPLAPADAASASVSFTVSATISMSLSTSLSVSVTVTNTMSFSPSDTPSFSTSLSPSFSTSLTNSGSPSFSASVPNSNSATKSIGATPVGTAPATPAPNHVPGMASPGLPVTASPTPGLGSKGTKFAQCGNGVKNPGEQCEYMIPNSGGKTNPCCTKSCRFRKSLKPCGKATTCFKPPRCGAAGVCDAPVKRVYKSSCKTADGRQGACMYMGRNFQCNPSVRPRSVKMMQRLLERRLNKMRNQDLAARGLLPQQEQEEEYEDDEEFSDEEEFLADLNNSTDSQ